MRINIAAATAVAAAALAHAVPAKAAVTCSMSGQKLTVTATASDDEIVFTRLADGALRVTTNGSTVVACTGGTPDMDGGGNLATVEVQDTSGGNVFVAFDLSGGTFAPGAAGDATETGAPELEFELALGAGIGDTVVAYGTEANETIDLGMNNVIAGMNLNHGAETAGSRDADVALLGVESAGAEGRDGNDTLRASAPEGSGFTSALTGVEVTLAGGAGDDVVIGGLSDDSLYGGAGNDAILSGPPADAPFNRLYPGTGDDFVGGSPAGGDEVDYWDANAGVTVDLTKTSEQDTGGGGSDILQRVQVLHGSPHDDVLLGDADHNALWGGGGDDVLAGRAGSDLMGGGAGVDVAEYADAPAAVTIDLGVPEGDWQDTGSAGNDTLMEMEGVIGSAFADALKGDGGPNVLDGGPGEDELTGLGGADRFLLRDGVRDTAACGDGSDTVVSDAAGVDAVDANCEEVELFVPPVDPPVDPPTDPPADPAPVEPAPSPSPSPAPLATPSPKADSSVELLLRAPRRQRGRAVRATVGCGAEACTARASGRIVIGRRRVRLGGKVVQVAAGRAAPLRLVLGRSAARRVRQALQRGKRVDVRLTVTVTDAAGNRRTATRSARLVR